VAFIKKLKWLIVMVSAFHNWYQILKLKQLTVLTLAETYKVMPNMSLWYFAQGCFRGFVFCSLEYFLSSPQFSLIKFIFPGHGNQIFPCITFCFFVGLFYPIHHFKLFLIFYVIHNINMVD
jgi:hypothetical protein